MTIEKERSNYLEAWPPQHEYYPRCKAHDASCMHDLTPCALCKLHLMNYIHFFITMLTPQLIRGNDFIWIAMPSSHFESYLKSERQGQSFLAVRFLALCRHKPTRAPNQSPLANHNINIHGSVRPLSLFSPHNQVSFLQMEATKSMM